MVETERTAGSSIRIWVSADLKTAIDRLADTYRVEPKALTRQLLAEAVLMRENQLKAPTAMADAAIAQLLAGAGEHEPK